jgi:hypothetical protein
MAGRHLDASRRLVLPTSVAVAGLALIMLGQAVPNRMSIEDDLTERSTEALASSDLTGLTVTFSGRDASISGATQPDLAGRAVDLVSAVEGVRTAEADVTGGDLVPAPAESPAEAPSESASAAPAPTQAAEPVVLPVGFTLADGTITVTGTVPSDPARKALLDAAGAAGNGWDVVDRLHVETSLMTSEPDQGRFGAVTRLLATAPTGGTKLVIQYSKGSVILRGTPADADAERALLSAAAITVDKKANVIDGLDVTAP